MPEFSLIIPVYNRPDELDELLGSLCMQTDGDFEVVIVEDGSKINSSQIVEKYKSRLDLQYYVIPNSGPGQARNHGAGKSNGEYLIVLDSDCVIPGKYIESVKEELKKSDVDAFGGPDKALDSFTDIQKSINYSMTSFFTTGGIRGGKTKVDKFFPRSFNMGIKREVYEKLGGFSKMRFGEDIDFSIRIYKEGYKVGLFQTAYVYHKRRADFKKFFKQVYNSGIARINLHLRHKGTLKLVHAFPSLFTLFFLVSIFAIPWCRYGLGLAGLYALIIFIDASIQNKNIIVGFLSVIASFVQLIGYGTGFLSGAWNRLILRKGEFAAFEINFYK
jgi:glycosyltransferase involved in cell wall biosynthesis